MKLLALLLLLAAAGFALAAAPAAHATSWKRVTAPSGSAIDQVGAVRTADGVLHVAWRIQSGPNAEDLWHTTIGANGKVGPTVPIATGWASISDPGITAVPGGIRVFWGGIRTTEATETNQDFNTALSTDGGASWQLQTGSVVPDDAQAYASDAGAATLADGTTLQTWYGTLGAWVHSGLDPATPNSNFQTPLGSYGYNTGIAAAGGSATLAWFSNATGHLGVFAQGVNHDGTPIGSAQNMPGSATMQVGTVTRTPIAARAGGGYYVTYATGYPYANQVRVWKVGATKSTLLELADQGGNSETTVAADAKGRVWAAWSEGTFGDKHVFAARSNRQGTSFGVPVEVGVPKGTSSVNALDASATTTSLDLLAAFSVGSETGGATFVTRVLPGLAIQAKPSKLGQRATTVSFRVTDAGDPVKGAKVKASGQSDTTDASGRATLKLRHKATVTASASGYEDGSVKLK